MNEGSAEKCPKELTTIKTFGADKQTNKKEGRKEERRGRKEGKSAKRGLIDQRQTK